MKASDVLRDDSFSPASGGKSDWFGSATDWGMMEQARGEGPEAEEARELFCRRYRERLLAFGRYRGLSPEDAEDVVQDCLGAFLRREGFGKVDKGKGQLRCYLLSCFKNSVAEFHRRQRRKPELLTDVAGGKEAAEVKGVDGDSPDREFDRVWARDLLNRALGRLAEEAGPEKRRWLLPLVQEGRAGDGVLQEAAGAMGLSASAAKAKLHRMRQRYAELVREEVAATLVDPAPERVEEELRVLLQALAEG